MARSKFLKRSAEDPVAPTLIVPAGTHIEVDEQGQLSIRAPGNLVLQSSGRYGTLESVAGSIRIDQAADVEAVTVRCAGTCSVQGKLTAWKVVAEALHLEDSARAHIVLQETRRLEIGRDARLVGNFADEGEMLGLFTRFAHQVRSLRLSEARRDAPAELAEGRAGEPLMAGEVVPGVELPLAEADPDERLENLLLAMVLLEREAEQGIHPPAGQRALDEMVKLLQERDFDTLSATWRTLFGRIAAPGEDALQARELVARHLGAGGAGPGTQVQV
ncbi:MAG TPA: hypothetical protein VEG34_10250 [Thermoanaerobaculia bacterium]|nr:hypothetical protein [Thermoanaerobaculia bacterium]